MGGRVSEKTFKAVNELSLALATGDYGGVADALCNMGAADEEGDRELFAQDLERVFAKFNNVQADVTVAANLDGSISGARVDIDESDLTNAMLEIVDVTEDNGLKLPREFGLLVKQSLYFDRYMKILAPDVNVMNDPRIAMGGKTKEEIDEAGIIDV